MRACVMCGQTEPHPRAHVLSYGAIRVGKRADKLGFSWADLEEWLRERITATYVYLQPSAHYLDCIDPPLPIWGVPDDLGMVFAHVAFYVLQWQGDPLPDWDALSLDLAHWAMACTGDHSIMVGIDGPRHADSA